MSLSNTHSPGRGVFMDGIVLKNLVKASFYLQPSKLEATYNVKHGTAVRIRPKAQRLNLTPALVEKMTPTELLELWYHRSPRGHDGQRNKKGYLEPDFAAMQAIWSASRNHGGSRTEIKLELTRQLIIEEMYLSKENQKKAQEEDLELYTVKSVSRMWHRREKNLLPVYRRRYNYGDEIQMDFTGVKLSYLNHGQKAEADVLVMNLPASRYIIATAIASQQLEDVIPAIVNSLHKIAAVPRCLVVDNFKGAITKASKYGGIPNSKMTSMCSFFGMELMACRPYKPTDKGSVEASVKIVTRCILAYINKLQKQDGQIFNSIQELNEIINERLEGINNRKINAFEKSRAELLQEELHYMKVPANWNYDDTKSFVQTVPSNCILEFNGHRYAIDPKYSGNSIYMDVSQNTIRFRIGSEPIVIYERKDNIKGLSTTESYTSINNISYEIFGIEQDKMLEEWAESIGINTINWVRKYLTKTIRKNETVKGVVKVLSCAKGIIENYNKLDRIIGELVHADGNPALPTEIIDACKNHMFEDGTQDAIHNKEIHRNICMNVIYGKLPQALWPTEIPSHLQNNLGEFLQGDNNFRRKYQNISNAMKEVNNVAVTDMKEERV